MKSSGICGISDLGFFFFFFSSFFSSILWVLLVVYFHVTLWSGCYFYSFHTHNTLGRVISRDNRPGSFKAGGNIYNKWTEHRDSVNVSLKGND